MPLLDLVAAAGGLALGLFSPVVAVAVLLAVIAPTSALPWLLGAGNQVVPCFYTGGMLAGALLRAVRRREVAAESTGARRRLALMAALAATAVMVSSLLAMLRTLPRDGELLALEAIQAWLRIGYFNPPALAGQLQAAFVAVSGFAILLVCLRWLRSERDQRRLVAAALGGAALAVAAPLLQTLAGADRYVRADQRRMISSGWSGFFQDPQSYAAFLVLVIGLCGGLAWGRWRAGERRGAALPAGVAAAAIVPLMYTNSRGGLLAAVLTLAVLAARQAKLGGRRGRLAAAAAALVAVVAVGAVSFNTDLRERAYQGLTHLGNVRMWEALAPDSEPMELLSKRVLWWRKAVLISTQYPIWGIGPAGYFDAEVDVRDSSGAPLPARYLQENAHNYFLQFAAEYGLVAFALLVALMAAAMVTIFRGIAAAATPGEAGLLAGIFAAQVGFVALAAFSHPLLLAELQAWFWGLTAVGVVGGSGETPVDLVATREG